MTVGKYLHIEIDLGWWASVALAALLVWRVLAPPPAVPAFAPAGTRPTGEDDVPGLPEAEAPAEPPAADPAP